MRFEGFEGGQSPLQRRLPKFGFNAPNRKEFAVVNVGDLEALRAGATVDEAALREAGLVKGRWTGVKLLGEGKLSRKVAVHVHRVSREGRGSGREGRRHGGARPADGPQARGRGEGARRQGRKGLTFRCPRSCRAGTIR